MPLIADYNLIVSGGNVREKAAVAIAATAIAISGESDQTENYAARQIWVVAALRDPLAMSQRMLWGLVAFSGVSASTSDEDIATAVSSLVNHYAKLES